MNKNIVIIILLLATAGLSYVAYEQNTRIDELTATIENTSPSEPKNQRDTKKKTMVPAKNDESLAQTKTETEEANNTKDRMMRGISKMMENPMMNNMIKAQQRATIEEMYRELADSYGFTDEERKHFMELLFNRQMKRVEFGLKMMQGNLPEEEKQQLLATLKENDEYTKDEIKYFLNNDEDYENFDFYEKTQNERSTISGFAAAMENENEPISEGLKRDLTQIMYDENNNYNYTVKFDNNTQSEQFTSKNINTFINERAMVNQNVLDRANTLLSPKQQTAFANSLDNQTKMIQAQLEMAASLMGPKEK